MNLKLVRKQPEVPGVESFIFAPEEPLSWKAGQYLHYVLHHRPTDDRGSDRWFTVASAPFEKEITITTRLSPERGSTFKAALQALAVGESIEVSAIEGDFTVEDPSKEYVFLAGGIGITPFHSILKEADHAGTPLRVTLIYSNRDEHVPYKEELEAFAKRNPTLKIHYLTAPERIDESALRALVPDLSVSHFYVSGPAPMVKGLSETLTKMGIEESRIKQDDFPGYPAE